MSYIDRLVGLIRNKVNSRICKLEAEIATLKENQKNDVAYYGLGGPYKRRENAIQTRHNEIRDLREFLEQIQTSVITERNNYSIMHCNSCKNNILTLGHISEGWHECPVCRKMIYGSVRREEIIIVTGKR